VIAWVRKNAGYVAVGAIAFAALLLYVAWPYARHAEKPDLGLARAQLAACLFGHPIATGGVDALELRAIEIGARAADSTWPRRCEPYARAIDPKSRATTLLASGAVFEFLTRPDSLAELLEPAPDEAKVNWTRALEGVPVPPTPAQYVVEAAPFPGPGLTIAAGSDLVLYSLDGDFACRFASDHGGLEPIARCSLPADSWWLASHRSDPVDAGDPGQMLVETSDGIREFATGKLVSPSAAKLAGPSHARDDSTLVRDQLLWAEHGTIRARSITGGARAPITQVGAGTRIGDASCYSPDAVAVQLGAPDHHRLAVLIADKWQMMNAGRPLRLSCNGPTVTGVALDPTERGLVVHRVDCTASGCIENQEIVTGVGEKPQAIAVGEKVAIVWVDDLVRAKLAPLHELSAAPAIVLYDGYAHLSDRHLSRQELVHGMQVFSRGRSAIVVIEGQQTRAVHLRGARTVEPVSVVYE
jgi:hypothetical protein